MKLNVANTKEQNKGGWKDKSLETPSRRYKQYHKIHEKNKLKGPTRTMVMSKGKVDANQSSQFIPSFIL